MGLVLLSEETGERLPLSAHGHVGIQEDEGELHTRESVPTKHGICWHLDLGLT